MEGALLPGEGDDEIGLAHPQHPRVTDQGGVAPLVLPVGGVDLQLDAARLGPLSGRLVDAAGIALN